MGILIDASKSKGGNPLEFFEKIHEEVNAQPDWQTEATQAAAYYDGRQLSDAVIAVMKDRKQPILIHNLIAPAIDGVLGMEAKTRTEWLVRADNDDAVEVAEGLNAELNEKARLAKADRACADAYAHQVKCGLGWVEVGKNPDPFADSPYRIGNVHWREIDFDWFSREPDLSDARWLRRKRWVPVDQFESAFPQHKELIRLAGKGSLTDIERLAETDIPALSGALQTDYATVVQPDQWYDPYNKLLRAYEVWYRVYDRVLVMRSPEGLVMEFDRNNAMHVAAARSGRVEVINAPTTKIRLAYFLGPHRLVDIPSPHPHNRFPYGPFWGFREDGSGAPYGLIRRMMPAQDEINHRRSRLTWLLNAKRVIMDDDATLMKDSEIHEELARADGLIKMNPNRRNKDQNSFRVEQDFNIASQQFHVMQDAMKTIQDVAGVYSAFLGKESGASSGIAINSLVEQGTVTLGELNDNYRYGRNAVGDLLMSNIIADIGRRERTVVIGVHKPTKTKRIVLNQLVQQEGKPPVLTNAVQQARLKVVLDDVSKSPGYRAQQNVMLAEIMKTLPPQFQAACLDLWVDSMDSPHAAEISKRIRSVTGQGLDPAEMTDDERAALESRKKAEAEQQQLQIAQVMAAIDKVRAEAARAKANADLTDTQREKLNADIELVMARVEEIRASLDAQMEQTIKEDAAALGLGPPPQQSTEMNPPSAGFFSPAEKHA